MFNFNESQNETNQNVGMPQNNVKLLTLNAVGEKVLTLKTEQTVNNPNTVKVQKNKTVSEKKGDYTSRLQPNFNETSMDIWAKGEITYRNVCDFIKPVKQIISLDGKTENEICLFIKNDVETRYVYIPQQVITDGKELLKSLNSKQFIISNQNFANDLQSHIAINVRELMKNKQITYTYKSLGWLTSPNNKKIFVLDKVFGDDSLKAKFLSQNTFQSGSEEDYENFIEEKILSSKELTTALVLGLSSVVVSLLKDSTGIPNLILDIVNSTSHGKTIITQFMMSLFANPEIKNNGFIRTFNSTYNALMGKNAQFHGFPIIIDDASTKEGHWDFESMIYQLYSGEGKDRCYSTGTVQNKNDSWSGMIIFSSEQAMLNGDNCKSGAMIRLLILEDYPFFKDGQEADFVRSFILKNYGWVAPKFVNKLLEFLEKNKIEKILEIRSEQLKKIKKHFSNLENTDLRLCEQLSLIATTAELITMFLGYKIKTSDVIKPFIERHISLKNVLSLEDKAINIVAENFAKYKHKFTDDVKGKYAPTKDMYGTFSTGSNSIKINIFEQVLKDWLKEANIIEVHKILKTWRDNKTIYCHEKNRFTHLDSFLNARVVKLEINQNNFGNFSVKYPLQTCYPSKQDEGVITDPKIEKENLDISESLNSYTDEELSEIFGGEENG